MWTVARGPTALIDWLMRQYSAVVLPPKDQPIMPMWPLCLCPFVLA